MKKQLMLVMLSPLAIMAQKNFVINGSVTGLQNGSPVFVIDANQTADTVSRATVAEGKFVLKGTLPQPGLYHISFVSAQKKSLLFLDNSTIGLKGDVNNLQQLETTGSPTQKDFEEFQKTFNPLFTSYSKFNQQANSGGLTPQVQDTLEKLYNIIQAEVDKYVDGKKTSSVTPFVLLVTSQLSQDILLLEKRFNQLNDVAQQSLYGKMLKDMIDDGKVGAVGTDALDFIQNDTTGKPVSLSSFRGKYVLVDFWASWCGPCRQENPNVVETYHRFKNKNFTVLGVSLDKSKASWIQAIKDDNLPWTHVSDLKYWSNAVAVKYRIQSIPRNFLVDPSGKIVAKDLRGPYLSQKLEELLK